MTAKGGFARINRSVPKAHAVSLAPAEMPSGFNLRLDMAPKHAKKLPRKTLGDIIDALPFRKLAKSPVLHMDELPADVLPDLEMPETSKQQPSKPSRNSASRR